MQIHTIGQLSDDADDLPDGPAIILTGPIEEIRAAAKLFGEEVRVVRAALQDAPQ